MQSQTQHVLKQPDASRRAASVVKPPKRSHVMPCRLLSQFAEPINPCEGKVDRRRWQLWRYPLQGVAKQISVGEFVEKKFYSFTEKDGTRNDTHKTRMAKEIEGPFNVLLPLLESDLYVPNRADGRVIARYVANLFSRTHQRRNASKMQQEETARVTKALLNDHPKVLQLTAAYSFLTGHPMSVETVRHGTAALCRGGPESRDPFFLRNLERHEESLYALLEDKPFGLLRAPQGTSFITSDTGIITRVPLAVGFSIGEGFTKANMHTLLPISPRTCIQIGIPNLQLQMIRDDEVSSINADTIRLMHRWVYSNAFHPEIEKWISEFGGTVKYKVNAFVTKPLTKESFLDLLVSHICDDFFWPDSEFAKKLRRFREKRVPIFALRGPLNYQVPIFHLRTTKGLAFSD